MVVGKLYISGGSPAVRAVLLAAKALGIELEHIEVNLATGEHLKPEYLKLNPQHTVPTYVDQDGTAVWDSHAIMAYLVGKYGKTDSLYPKSLAKRAVVDQRMYFDAGSVFGVVGQVMVGMFKHGLKGPGERQVEGAVSAYEFLNTFLEGKQWIAGDNVTIADFSLIASVTSLGILVPIDGKFGNLLAWIKRCENLPYYDANAKGLAMFKAFATGLMK